MSVEADGYHVPLGQSVDVVGIERWFVGWKFGWVDEEEAGGSECLFGFAIHGFEDAWILVVHELFHDGDDVWIEVSLIANVTGIA